MGIAAKTQHRFTSYSAGNDNEVVFAAIDRAIEAALSRDRQTVAGSEAIELVREDLEGAWSLRFGRFGCPDSETRGGIVQFADEAFIGGDCNFVYRGAWQIEGSELTAKIDILRHGEDGGLLTVFGTDEDEYGAECVAEAITPDLFEGRIGRPGHSDIRVVLRRVASGRC